MSAKSAALTTDDRKLLLAALNAGLAFEKSFSIENEEPFRRALAACAKAESPLVTKLAELAAKVSFTLGAKHLMGLLVPLERLAGRSARDEEFLFSERDGASSSDVRAPAKASRRIVLCENVRSAFNVGAIFRTVETFGGSEIWLSGYSPDPLKTAMGTDAMITSKRFERASDALSEARRLGYVVVSLENAPGAIPIDSFTWPDKTVLVLGNERFGVDSETLAASDHVIRISTLGQKNSLNVGVAFGVAASQWHRTQASTPSPLTRSHGETITPIGYMRGGFANTQTAPRQGSYSDARGTIELASRFEGRPSNFEQALKDLEGFERAWVLFGFHETDGWLPQVRPPRGDGTKRGLFATRSPHRPNRLGLSCVRILRVNAVQLRIEISEHDLLEGTPIFDIKPYIPEADAFPGAKAGWVDHVQDSAFEISETESVFEKLAWLENQNETRLRGFIDEQLRFQPLDTDRKRLDLQGSGDAKAFGPHHTIAFRTWRLDFQIASSRPNGGGTIRLLDLRSSYSSEELNDVIDTYADKELHRKFQSRFGPAVQKS